MTLNQNRFLSLHPTPVPAEMLSGYDGLYLPQCVVKQADGLFVNIGTSKVVKVFELTSELRPNLVP